MYQKIVISILAFFVWQFSFAQKGNKEAEVFIKRVLAEYKNPMAYYPLRRDIFLPSEEEIQKMELEKSYPAGSRGGGVFVFVSKQSGYKRESFVDGEGKPMVFNFQNQKAPVSLKSNLEFSEAKQKQHLERYPNLGKFLYYNSLFKKPSTDF